MGSGRIFNRVRPLLFYWAIVFFVGACAGPKNSAATDYKIIDVHEHLQSLNKAKQLLDVMDGLGIETTVLVASPEELFLEKPTGSLFSNAENNNHELLKISKAYPNRFYAFATYSPLDKNVLSKFKLFMRSGGKGLKLYNGHIAFYDKLNTPLDAPHLMELYRYCEKNRIPIVFHANARFYWHELEHILNTYPDLIVNLPHYCMALVNIPRMREIFERYPNTYADISLGHYEFAYPALSWISDHIDSYRNFVVEFQDRFLFATDMVLSDHPDNDKEYMNSMLWAYRLFLEQKRYTNILIRDYIREFGKGNEAQELNGLSLSETTLRKIYSRNAYQFLGKLKD